MKKGKEGSSVYAARTGKEWKAACLPMLAVCVVLVSDLVSLRREGSAGVNALGWILPLCMLATALVGAIAAGAAGEEASYAASGNQINKEKTYGQGILLTMAAGVLLFALSEGITVGLSRYLVLSETLDGHLRSYLLAGRFIYLPLGLLAYLAVHLYEHGHDRELLLVTILPASIKCILNELHLVRDPYLACGAATLYAASIGAALAVIATIVRRETHSVLRLSLSPARTGRIFASGGIYGFVPMIAASAILGLDAYILYLFRKPEETMTVLTLVVSALIIVLLLTFGVYVTVRPMLMLLVFEKSVSCVKNLMNGGIAAFLIATNVVMIPLFCAAPWISQFYFDGHAAMSCHTALQLFAPFPVFYAASAYYIGYMRAAGHKRMSLVLAILTGLVFPILMSIAGTFVLGGTGLWLGLGGAGAVSFLLLLIVTARVNRSGEHKGVGILMLDEDLLKRQRFYTCLSTREEIEALLNTINRDLDEEGFPEHFRYRVSSMLQKMTTALAEEETELHHIDCILTTGSTNMVVLRDDGVLSDKADPRHLFRSFRQYALSRSRSMDSDAAYMTAQAENRTVFRL